MRIGVRARCQRQGIGRKLLEYLFEHYPAHLSLDVSTDNAKAIGFYHRMGLKIEKKYITEEEKVEFATFTTPEDFKYVPRPPTVPQESMAIQTEMKPCEIEETKNADLQLKTQAQSAAAASQSIEEDVRSLTLAEQPASLKSAAKISNNG